MFKTFIQEKSDDPFFYRDGIRRFLVLAVILLVVNYGLIGVLFYRLISIPDTKFFATTSDGRLLELTKN